jgi:acyl-CoA synthetase (NDP forming)
MTQRSVPFAYMVSAGNQTQIHLEDFIDALCDYDEVRAFGLHIEGLKDVGQFERSALKAMRMGKPIVALKTGTSALGSRLTVSHTGSLSGAEEIYNAFFERLGIIRVTSPSQLLETVKLLSVSGIPKGRRVAGLTCSGGGATMLADHAERVNLDFPLPSDAVATSLRQLLPQTATVSNPLDYTTPIWGMPEKTAPVFRTLFSGEHDAAVIVQDYPAAGLDESKQYYRNDTITFLEAAKKRGLVAAVCSTLPENLDAETRDFLVREGVAPMQGIEECLNAIAHGAWFHERREVLLKQGPKPLLASDAVAAEAVLLDEAKAKALLAGTGIRVPQGITASGKDAAQAAMEIGFPVALKMVSERLPHKTEAGAVRLSLRTADDVSDAVSRMKRDVTAHDAAAVTDLFLLERMAGPAIMELMVGIRRDPQFGYAMTLASGGVFVELLADAVTLLLPASRDEMSASLSRLRMAPLIGGYRGKPAADRHALLDTLERLAAYATQPSNAVVEIEINPLFVMADGVCAVDVLMQIEKTALTS